MLSMSRKNRRTARAGRPRISQQALSTLRSRILDSNQLARQPLAEVKQYAASATAASIWDGAGNILSDMTAGITQGVADNQRIGDSLWLQNVEVKALGLCPTGVNTPGYCYFRVIIFQFKGDSTNAPTIANLLLTSNMNNGSVAGSWSFYDKDHVRLLRVLYDSHATKHGTIGSNGLAVTGAPAPLNGPLTSFEFNVPLARASRQVNYYAAGAQGDGHIYFLATTDQSQQTNNPSLTYGYVIRFTDA